MGEWNSEQRIRLNTQHPMTCRLNTLHASRGSFGFSLKGMNREESLLHIPTYAREKTFPIWKQHYIRHNRNLYESNKSWIQGWMKQLRDLHPSHQKLEWNCGREQRDIWRHLISFRPSGIRGKENGLRASTRHYFNTGTNNWKILSGL